MKTQNKFFTFYFFILKSNSERNLKNFLFQFNRFENGNCTIYLRLLKIYSFSIYNIKGVKNKRYFLGNKDN